MPYAVWALQFDLGGFKVRISSWLNALYLEGRNCSVE